MSREKGTGNLQKEKSGRWTLRVGINGRRISRSTGTTERAIAEKFLERFLAPLGLGAIRLPLAEAWQYYEMSPNRRDVANNTLDSKRKIWMNFAMWVEKYHLEITHLAEVTDEAVAEYLQHFRSHHSATTYNNHVCTLREVFRTLADKAGVVNDPWRNVQLRADDSVSRRELTMDEVNRVYEAACKTGPEWKLLIMTGIYTGLRLGDCCRLSWDCINLERRVIQVIPQKTRKHAHGKPVTIPIHPMLLAELMEIRGKREEGRGKREEGREETATASSPLPLPSSPLPLTSSLLPLPSSLSYVNPVIADLYDNRNWELDDTLRRIFKAANITMSVRVTGRCRKCVLASFHSLRHTFVSLSANAGVPLPVVQSIVGHCSTAMTRHYYHESEAALRQAVAAIPELGVNDNSTLPAAADGAHGGIATRLKTLAQLFSDGLISETEYNSSRTRILSEI